MGAGLELVWSWFGSWFGTGLATGWELVWQLVWNWFGNWFGAGLATGLELVWQLVQDLVHGVGVFTLSASSAPAYLAGLAILADTLRIATINAKTPLVASYVHMLDLLTFGALASP